MRRAPSVNSRATKAAQLAADVARAPKATPIPITPTETPAGSQGTSAPIKKIARNRAQKDLPL
jgi:hypothetical protein